MLENMLKERIIEFMSLCKGNIEHRRLFELTTHTVIEEFSLEMKIELIPDYIEVLDIIPKQEYETFSNYLDKVLTAICINYLQENIEVIEVEYIFHVVPSLSKIRMQLLVDKMKAYDSYLDDEIRFLEYCQRYK